MPGEAATAQGRRAASERFLARAGWQDAARAHLAGDASERSYARLRRGQDTAVLMDAPPGGADDPADFVAIAAHLAAIGLSPPQVLAQDLQAGFLLLEDLGDGLFARLLAADPAREMALYAAATDVLVHLQAHPAPPGLPDLSARDWAAAAALVLEAYVPAATGAAPPTADLVAALAAGLARHADGPRVLILRDYHAENLLLLPGREGVAAVGLLDFQLGQMGQPGYDLVSLVQDARRDVVPGTAEAMVRRFQAATGAADMAPALAVLGAQRALRIIGVFARLCTHAGKPGYLAMLPRVWGHLQANLAHPALVDLAGICHALIPAPTPAILERIARQCPPPPPR
ncbi:MAG: aminoglycoside phosphotransferase family protein [Gemmobacter sp.]